VAREFAVNIHAVEPIGSGQADDVVSQGLTIGVGGRPGIAVGATDRHIATNVMGMGLGACKDKGSLRETLVPVTKATKKDTWDRSLHGISGTLIV
jgi:hypothetical protein